MSKNLFTFRYFSTVCGVSKTLHAFELYALISVSGISFMKHIQNELSRIISAIIYYYYKRFTLMFQASEFKYYYSMIFYATLWTACWFHIY